MELSGAGWLVRNEGVGCTRFGFGNGKSVEKDHGVMGLAKGVLSFALWVVHSSLAHLSVFGGVFLKCGLSIMDHMGKGRSIRCMDRGLHIEWGRENLGGGGLVWSFVLTMCTGTWVFFVAGHGA